MTHAEYVSLQIANIASRPAIRACNELRDDYEVSDMQALDAPRFVPPTTWSDSITMRHVTVISGRGGDHANS